MDQVFLQLGRAARLLPAKSGYNWPVLRRLITILAVVSVVFCLASLGGWLASYIHWGRVDIRIDRNTSPEARDEHYLSSSRGSIRYAVSRIMIVQFIVPDFNLDPTSTRPASTQPDYAVFEDQHFAALRRYCLHPTLPEWCNIEWFGTWPTNNPRGRSLKMWHVGFIYPTLIFAVLPLGYSTGAFRRYRRIQRRAALGLCPRCGYDLRASKERCPECGKAIADRDEKR